MILFEMHGIQFKILQSNLKVSWYHNKVILQVISKAKKNYINEVNKKAVGLSF